MLYFHTSNKLEQLKIQYAAVVNTPLTDPLKEETVVVQNAGMARWLSMEMSQLAGISANTKFLFPAEFMWNLLRLVSPSIPEHSQCAPDTLRFRIYDELITNYLDYPELKHYILDNPIHDDSSQSSKNESQLDLIKIWELSCQSATLLDQYLFYRGEWINSWESTSDNNQQTDNPLKFSSKQDEYWSNHWQARIWNRCVKNNKLLHWLALQEQFSQNIENFDSSLLPERISFFSMSALSPGYIDLLGGIAQKTDIHIFIINPCADIYWGDIQSPKTHSKLSNEEQEYSEIGNPLLASLGKQGRDFINRLLEIPEQGSTGFSNDYENTDTIDNQQNLLAQVQHDIYNLEEAVANLSFDKFDDSIHINSCHTAMREVEVLHDQILAELDSDPDLATSDIVVMMPDIEKYAPYIESIFSNNINKNSTANKEQKLPFSIADRDPQNIFKIIQALNKLLTLPDTRFDVDSVFELLEYDEIREHFGLDQDQLNYCRDLALATNIRWGISDKTRQQNSLPNTEEHTWKYALDRMLLGYSISETSSNEQLFKSKRNLELLAYTEIEGSNALVLSNFKRFTDIVFSINEWQNKTLNLDKWISKTTQLIQLISPESTDQQRIFKALSDIQIKADLAEFNKELSYVVYQKMLQQCLADISANEKYLGYGITFCALVPMRSVPFKIVALMGMNDGEFPRQDSRPSFDLMADNVRPGDRSRRDEDRYLFLESILAARKKLIISYIGQSIKDNTSSAPSILVSELLDTLTVISGIEANDWIIKHPLQAFSPRYFISDHTKQTQEIEQHPLFSYAAQYLQLSSKNDASQTIHSDFITNSLETLSDEYKTISLTDLINFFKNPSRIFLNRRFNIQTFDDNNELQTREPFDIEFFKDKEIRGLILQNIENEKTIEIKDTNNPKQIARAKGLLPYGEIGNEIFEKEYHTVDVFNEGLTEQDRIEDKQISLAIGEFQLNAKLDQLTTKGRYVKRLTKPYAGDYIELWLTHLCLNAYYSDSNNEHSHSILQSEFHSPDNSFHLSPVNDAQQQLDVLLKYYWSGLHFPLSFFPKSAFALYSKKGKLDLTSMNSKWNGSDFVSAEKNSFEHWLLFRDLELDKDNQPEEFMSVSEDLFGRLFESLTELNAD